MFEVRPFASRPRALVSAALVLVTGAFAVGLGAAVGNPTPGGFLIFAVVGAAAVVAFALSAPFRGFLVMVASAFVLAVVAVTDDRYLNAYDLLLPTLGLMWMYGRGARATRFADAQLTGPGHDAISAATHGFSRAVIIYFVVIGMSLVMLFRLGSEPAITSTYSFARAVEGVLIFPLGLWLLRSEDRIRSTYSAVLVGAGILAVVNAYQVIVMHTGRMGMTWVMNHLDWPVESANEMGASLVMLFALVMAHHATRPRTRNYFIFGALILMLLLTMSRSGLLALFTFMAFGLRRIRPRYLLAGLGLLGLTLIVVPYDFWWRMTRTLTFHRGSFEVYTIMIRIFGYVTGWRTFLDNWLFGVGYIGGRYVSQDYNELKIANLGAENFYIDTAAGTGLIGLAAVTYCFVTLFKLGAAVRRVTPPGSFPHELARLHAPLIVALMVANLTGNTFVGMVPLAQIAIWCLLMIRGGHLVLEKVRTGEQPEEGPR